MRKTPGVWHEEVPPGGRAQVAIVSMSGAVPSRAGLPIALPLIAIPRCVQQPA
ncbi:hypothetical protein [Xanthomonas melonis]|uniref:hypothetical protein n=1 Tax=Xanthomonas melonis TaxID=56456 RepID=UPI00142DDDD8|nr:hypothetical protein [Xanthomonas melonis]